MCYDAHVSIHTLIDSSLWSCFGCLRRISIIVGHDLRSQRRQNILLIFADCDTQNNIEVWSVVRFLFIFILSIKRLSGIES